MVDLRRSVEGALNRGLRDMRFRDGPFAGHVDEKDRSRYSYWRLEESHRIRGKGLTQLQPFAF
jgi:hypothetical protein